jgi:hypothetical protein
LLNISFLLIYEPILVSINFIIFFFFFISSLLLIGIVGFNIFNVLRFSFSICSCWVLPLRILSVFLIKSFLVLLSIVSSFIKVKFFHKLNLDFKIYGIEFEISFLCLIIWDNLHKLVISSFESSSLIMLSSVLISLLFDVWIVGVVFWIFSFLLLFSGVINLGGVLNISFWLFSFSGKLFLLSIKKIKN